MNRLQGRHIPCITAHAGCMDTAPNSRESILAAFASEADIVEVDVRLTRDGTIVLSHDDSLSFPTEATSKVKDLSWEEVEQYSTSNSQAILRLEAFLDLAAECGREKLLNLDIKDHYSLPAASAMVRSRRLEDSVLFSGLMVDGIKAARACMPDLTYFFNADEMVPLFGMQPTDMEAACEVALQYGCRGINLEWTRASEAFVSFAKSKDLMVMLWTADTEAKMRTALTFRPDSLTTNYPDILAQLIERSIP